MKRFLALVEILFPIVLAGVVTPVLLYYGFKPNLTRFEKLVDGSITFASIIVGFLSAMLGILVSIKESKIVKAIFEHRAKGQLAYFFSESIFLGFVVIGLAGALYLVMDIKGTMSENVFTAWTGSLLWFLFSSIRIIIVMLLILFHDPAKSRRPDGNNLTEEERRLARIANSKK